MAPFIGVVPGMSRASAIDGAIVIPGTVPPPKPGPGRGSKPGERRGWRPRPIQRRGWRPRPIQRSEVLARRGRSYALVKRALCSPSR